MLKYNPGADAPEITLPDHWKIGGDLRPTWQVTPEVELSLEASAIAAVDGDHRVAWSYRLRVGGDTVIEVETTDPNKTFSTPWYGSLDADTFTAAATHLLGALLGSTEEADPKVREFAVANEFSELPLYAQDMECGYCGGDHNSAACTSTA